jgi:membrane protease YdiL (CAAX protease family)
MIMNKQMMPIWPIIVTVILASVLWFFAFSISLGNFWVKISISAALLAICAFCFKQGNELRIVFNLKSIIIGLGFASVLYVIFLIGQAISHFLFSFSQSQVNSIYGLGKGSSMWMIIMLLLFVTGPAEEIYWRGFLQKRLADRYGAWQGWLLATAVYAGVHICSLNFMLVGAAAVAGLFWGWLYWRLDNLALVMISHATWSAAIFAIFPTI